MLVAKILTGCFPWVRINPHFFLAQIPHTPKTSDCFTDSVVLQLFQDTSILPTPLFMANSWPNFSIIMSHRFPTTFNFPQNFPIICDIPSISPMFFPPHRGPPNGCPLAQVIPKMVSALGDGRATGALRALTALSATGHDALAKNALPKVQEFICRWGLPVSARMLAFVVILYTYITQYIYIYVYHMYYMIYIYK